MIDKFLYKIKNIDFSQRQLLRLSLCRRNNFAEPLFIKRIFWCIHPYCYSKAGKDIYKDAESDPVLDLELKTHDKHLDFISSMKKDEAMVLFPSQPVYSIPFKKMFKHAVSKLGRRLVVIVKHPPATNWLKNKAEPVKEFLSGDTPAKKKWLRQTNKLKNGLGWDIEKEVANIGKIIGYNWSFKAFQLLCDSHAYAQMITKKFHDLRLNYDNNSVEGVAFGEGFEQCAMTIKALFPKYLNLRNPIENDFDLSVSSAPFLLGAKLKKRISLNDRIRLFIWEGKNERLIALFSFASAYFTEPGITVDIPAANLKWEIKNVYGENKEYRVENGFIKFRVFNPLRINLQDTAEYILAGSTNYGHFEKAILNCHINCVQIGPANNN